MHHLFIALAGHPDVAKLEFEDGVHAAAAELLAEESGRRQVTLDLRRESTVALAMEAERCSWDGALLVSAIAPGDVDLDAIGSSLADVAVVAESWPTTVIEVSGLETDWVGAAVPASKLSFSLSSARGVDTASFESWLRNELSEAQLPDADFGCRALVSEVESDADALVSFWFTDRKDLQRAADKQLFAPIASSSLIEPESVRTFASVEHRRTPNPNAWAMPTGPLMPVRDADDD